MRRKRWRRRVRRRASLFAGLPSIPQQLVKNLFFTTHRNPLRKLLEYTLAPMADRILGKRRELELYLNVVEWGPSGRVRDRGRRQVSLPRARCAAGSRSSGPAGGDSAGAAEVASGADGRLQRDHFSAHGKGGLVGLGETHPAVRHVGAVDGVERVDGAVALRAHHFLTGAIEEDLAGYSDAQGQAHGL